MIGAGKAVLGNDFTSERTEPAFHSVASDGIPDFPGNGKADSLLRVTVLAVADQEHEAAGRGSPSGVRREEIRAFLDRSEAV